MIDYYEILEVSPNASLEVIKAAYKTLLHRYNLEHDVEDRTEVQKLDHLNLAYDVLSDHDKRIEYDHDLEKFRDLNKHSTQYATDDSADKNAARLNQGDLNQTGKGDQQETDRASILSRLKWNKWGWSVSILAVAAILISMVQPDPKKVRQGQVAVQSLVEKKELETAPQKAAEQNKQAGPIENKAKEGVAK